VSTRRVRLEAEVQHREQLSPQLVRLVVGGEQLTLDQSTGLPDEWVGLVVPGQFQTRFYTVRSWVDGEVTLDVVVHDAGLVTDWATGDCVGDAVELTDPKGSFRPPADARWIRLVTDLTGLPATARICAWAAARPEPLPVQVWAEGVAEQPGYLPEGTDVTWLEPPAPGESALAATVEAMSWPAGPGYFWMAGESAQMRAIRKHLSRDLGMPSASYNVTGYWRRVVQRQPRAADLHRGLS
jgi:NADPH-dependent ferric siderophore reductase